MRKFLLLCSVAFPFLLSPSYGMESSDDDGGGFGPSSPSLSRQSSTSSDSGSDASVSSSKLDQTVEHYHLTPEQRRALNPSSSPTYPNTLPYTSNLQSSPLLNPQQQQQLTNLEQNVAKQLGLFEKPNLAAVKQAQEALEQFKIANGLISPEEREERNQVQQIQAQIDALQQAIRGLNQAIQNEEQTVSAYSRKSPQVQAVKNAQNNIANYSVQIAALNDQINQLNEQERRRAALRELPRVDPETGPIWTPSGSPTSSAPSSRPSSRAGSPPPPYGAAFDSQPPSYGTATLDTPWAQPNFENIYLKDTLKPLDPLFSSPRESSRWDPQNKAPEVNKAIPQLQKKLQTLDKDIATQESNVNGLKSFGIDDDDDTIRATQRAIKHYQKQKQRLQWQLDLLKNRAEGLQDPVGP